MSLLELQATALELCFGSEPRPEHFARLGDERIWRIYRDAIRTRLLDELEVALARTRAAAGAVPFERAFARFLASNPPRTRFFHAVVGCFADSAVAWFRDDSELPGHVADLCAYEAARWSVADESDEAPAVVAEFAFDRRPVLARAVRLLALQHAVHIDALPGESPAAGEFLLCVYRRPTETKARFFTLNPITHALMLRLMTSDESVTRAVEVLAAQRSFAVDAAFLEGLCTVLADFIERGIILGSH